MELFKTTEITFFSAWRLKDPSWYHGYNAQHGVLTPHVTPCSQRSKKFQNSTSFLLIKKKVSGNEVLL